MKRESGITVRLLVALLLLAISFSMLLFPWLGASIEILGRDWSLPDLVDFMCRYQGISDIQFEMQIQEGFIEYAEELAEETGVLINAQKAAKTYGKMLDGGISLLDAATICGYTGGLLKDINQAMSLDISNLSPTERISLMTINDLGTKLTIAAIVLWIVIAALLITFFLAIYKLLVYKTPSVVPYTVAVAVPFVATVIGVIIINNWVQGYAGTVADAIESILWAMGVHNYTAQKLNIFHLTAAPFISLICAVGTILIMSLRFERMPKVMGFDTKEITKLTKWTCACGAQNKLGNMYCASCGAKRPEKPKCDCGAIIVPGTKYCGKCGKIIKLPEENSIIPPRPTPTYCPHCGSLMEGSVCKRCSARERQYGQCERCGAQLYGNDTLCESCKAAESPKLRGYTWKTPSDSELD